MDNRLWGKAFTEAWDEQCSFFVQSVHALQSRDTFSFVTNSNRFSSFHWEYGGENDHARHIKKRVTKWVSIKVTARLCEIMSFS